MTRTHEMEESNTQESLMDTNLARRRGYSSTDGDSIANSTLDSSSTPQLSEIGNHSLLLITTAQNAQNQRFLQHRTAAETCPYPFHNTPFKQPIEHAVQQVGQSCIQHDIDSHRTEKINTNTNSCPRKWPKQLLSHEHSQPQSHNRPAQT